MLGRAGTCCRADRYMWASVQTVRGCPKHCSFCSVWRTDGQKPRVRTVDAVIEEIVELRRRGFRFIALADDNFYPVTLERPAHGRSPRRQVGYDRLKAIRDERFELMERLAKLPSDMVFFTQITMEAAEDPEFLDAMRKARIKRRAGRRRVGDARGPEGRLQGLQPRRRRAGRAAAGRSEARRARARLVHLRPAERRPATFDATAALAQQAGRHVRAVRDADAVPGHARLPEVGSVGRPTTWRRSTAFRSRGTG